LIPTSGNSALLDTNAVIAFRGMTRSVTLNLRAYSDLAISAITLGELFFGAQNSERREENLEELTRVIAGIEIIPIDSAVAAEYPVIRHELKRRGLPIPRNDMWIAATARLHSMTLVTCDRHFHSVKGLSVLGW